MAMFMLSPSSLSVVGDVLRQMLREVVAIVLIASCMIGWDRSCGLGRLVNRVEEKPECAE